MGKTVAIFHNKQDQDLNCLQNPFSNLLFCRRCTIQHLSSLGIVTAEDPLDVELTCQNLDIPQSSSVFYLRRLVRELQHAAIVIINGMSICFLGRGNEVLLMDSHLQYGALIGKTDNKILGHF